MKKNPISQSGLFNARVLLAFSLCSVTVLLPEVSLAALAGTAPVENHQPAAAAGILFLVNSTGDGDDAFPGDGVCETAAGNNVCTLRAAIHETNVRNNGGDGISISPSDAGCSGGICTITLTSALPSLTTTVSISGPGQDKLIVQPNTSPANFRIFNVTSTGTVSFSRITIDGGRAIDGSGGGAIHNASTGIINITNCTLSNNIGVVRGGAISNSSSGRVNLTSSYLVDNEAILSNGAAYGGGIFNQAGTVNIINSSIWGNTALAGSNYDDVGYGGGVFNDAVLIVVNSTIDSNIAGSASLYPTQLPGRGGGIYNTGTAIISNCTISFNDPSAGGRCGGIENSGGTVQVKSSIIAQNQSYSGGADPDVVGSFLSAGFNLIGARDGSTGFTEATDQTGTLAALLHPGFDIRFSYGKTVALEDNGGPTLTRALLCGSPAIDKGSGNSLTGTLATDQRGSGFARTVNDPLLPNANGGDGTDIGAFEYGAGIVASSAVSRKFHGSGSPPAQFDIPLALSCSSLGIECRRNTGADTTGPNAGRDHQVIVTFGSNVTVGSVEVASAVFGSATFSVSNNVVTVDLHNVPNEVRPSVNLRGVNDGTISGLVSIPMGVLLGDVNGSGVVTSGDANLCKGQALQPITNSNFRDDINVSGTISSGDLNVIKQHALEQLPP
jgi:Dockerin type I domain